MTEPEPLRPGECILWQASLGLLRLARLDRLCAMPELIGPVRRRLALLAIAPLLLANGCRRDPIFIDMSDSTFVRTMVALRTLPIGLPDTVARARQRDSVLRIFGVTAAQVESTAIRLAADPERAAVIWRAIENPSPTPPP